MKLKIAILGTRGIPNHYGGYEQAATFLSEGLVKKGHTVIVYNSHNHPYKEKDYHGVEIVHCYDPESRTGTAGQFIYDLNCLRHAHKRNYDVLLLMGYTSSSIWGRFYPKRTIIISNMDGLEWKRSKYSAPVRQYLKYAEKLAVKFSNYLIADSPVIRQYLLENYKADSCYIPYGAVIRDDSNKEIIKEFTVEERDYYLLIARMEPENNIETILDGFAASRSSSRFIVIGNTGNKYGKSLIKKFRNKKQVVFAGAVFDNEKLNSLRSNCKLYFHGHSVGGTNPSLLEAMASSATVVAHDNPFNKAVLGDDAFYFSSPDDVADIINAGSGKINGQMARANMEKIKQYYTWEKITGQYESFIIQCYTERHP